MNLTLIYERVTKAFSDVSKNLLTHRSLYDQQVISYVEMLTALASVINLSAVSLERSKLDSFKNKINVAHSQL